MHYKVKRLVYLLIGILVLFQLIRLLFIVLNQPLFQNFEWTQYPKVFFVGLVYDVHTAMLINLPLIILSLLPFLFTDRRWWKYTLLFLFLVPNTIALLANLVDIFYYPYPLDRLNFSIFEYLETQNNFSLQGVDILITYWYGFALLILMIYLMSQYYHWVYKRIEQKENHVPLKNTYLKLSLIVLVGAKGSFNLLGPPISMNLAQEQFDDAVIAGSAMNSMYTVLYSMQYEPTKIGNNKKNFSKLKTFKPLIEEDSMKKNVVFIILESFTKEASGYLNKDLFGEDYEGYTPFLDSIMSVSYCFNNAAANGKRSMDAVPALVAGIPASSNPYILWNEDEEVFSLASILNENGYTSHFFHGSDNGTMAFDRFCTKADINHYYGLNEYMSDVTHGNSVKTDKDNDGTWGIWDEPYFEYMADHLDEVKTPFFASVFSLTSHVPFVVPEEYIGRFPKGENGLEETIAYTDFALKQFFNHVSKSDWYDNTLFVITADHTSVPWSSIYAKPANIFNIPMMFYDPGSRLQGSSDEPVDHIDVFPTICNYLDLPIEIDLPGQDMFSDELQFSIYQVNQIFHLKIGDYMLVANEKVDIGLYNYRTDYLMHHNLVETSPDMVASMRKHLDQWIEKYRW